MKERKEKTTKESVEDENVFKHQPQQRAVPATTMGNEIELKESD
jgi:hypothetical protein